MGTLAEIGAEVDWPDADASSAARAAARHEDGRLGELAEWLAGVQGTFPPAPPTAVRLVHLDPVAERAADLAAQLGAGVHELAADDGVTAGIAAADAEIDSGTELIVLAADTAAAAALAVAVLTDAEPVALLPRGAASVDTQGWIERATALRDGRRRLTAARGDGDRFLDELGDRRFAAVAALALRAAARRTPVVLDGTAAVAAALVGSDVQLRATRWWQVADTSSDPVHARAVEQLGKAPLLSLGTADGTGIAGLLAVAVLRAAALTVGLRRG